MYKLDEKNMLNKISEIESSYQCLVVYQGWMEVFEGFIPNQPCSSNNTGRLNINWHKGFCISDPMEKSLICFNDKNIADNYCDNKISIRIDHLIPIEEIYNMSTIEYSDNQFNFSYQPPICIVEPVNGFSQFSSKKCLEYNIYKKDNYSPQYNNILNSPTSLCLTKSATLSKLDVKKKKNYDLRNLKYHYNNNSMNDQKKFSENFFLSTDLMTNTQTIPKNYYYSSILNPINGKFLSKKKYI
uniref:C-type lectin domain-containing protein n=1 Tax=Parastrongyloides trichosuri TaxID=131310 RepID=A0A0N4ZZ51_PARTI